MNEMNVSPWRLLWPERADIVEQWRSWRPKPWKLVDAGIEVEGPERHVGSRAGNGDFPESLKIVTDRLLRVQSYRHPSR